MALLVRKIVQIIKTKPVTRTNLKNSLQLSNAPKSPLYSTTGIGRWSEYNEKRLETPVQNYPCTHFYKFAN